MNAGYTRNSQATVYGCIMGFRVWHLRQQGQGASDFGRRHDPLPRRARHRARRPIDELRARRRVAPSGVSISGWDPAQLLAPAAEQQSILDAGELPVLSIYDGSGERIDSGAADQHSELMPRDYQVKMQFAWQRGQGPNPGVFRTRPMSRVTRPAMTPPAPGYA
jgi:hypothetical protein